MNKFFSLLFLLLPFFYKAQIKVDTLRLYYAVNEISSEANDLRVDSLVTAIGGKFIKIKVTGYADFLHTPAYNQALSIKRAEHIKNILVKKIPPVQLNSISSKGLGEKKSKDDGNKEGQASQRKVEVIVEPFVIVDAYPQSNASEQQPVEAKKNIEDLGTGETLAIEGLNFEPGKHFLKYSSIPVLNKLLTTLQKNPRLKIEIQGHICCVDGEEDGMDADTHQKNLSLARAKAIYDFLVAKGIDADRLTYKGYGRSKPKVFPEKTEADEQMNRRVEIMVLEK